MEDEEGIGLILARATELKLKIVDCIDTSTTSLSDDGVGGGERNEIIGNEAKDSDSISSDDIDETESERLLRIRDALESLESQLSALQNLRQRQEYEKQMALSEIDYSRKMLLEKLKEYKGKDFEVLRETTNFAGERVDYENDLLLLPPYPVHPPPLGYLSDLPKQKPDTNGFKTNKAEPESPERSSNSVVRFLGFVGKVVIPIIGVISALYVSGYGPEIRRRGDALLGVLPRKASKECPSGKVLVVQDGEARCLVKERVELPFDSVVARRDLTYGLG